MAVKRASESAVQQFIPSRSDDLAKQREDTLVQVAKQQALLAEEDPERKEGFAARLLREDLGTVKGIIQRDPGVIERLPVEKREAAERIQGGSVDFLPANFLSNGARVARSVGRVLSGNSALGTAFFIAPGVIMTNQHVLEGPGAAAIAEFELDYEYDAAGRARQVTRFKLDSTRFLFSAEDELDFAIVALGNRTIGKEEPSAYPFCPLRDSKDRHAKGACVNIVQHPDGRPKEISLRENRITARDDRVLLYEADTLPGSSGSPVFNDIWDLIALHHYGAPSGATIDVGTATAKTKANEGIRISAIVEHLRRFEEDAVEGPERQLARRVLEAASEPMEGPVRPLSSPGDQSRPTRGPISISRPANLIPTASHAAAGVAAPPSDLQPVGLIQVPIELFARVVSPSQRASVLPSPQATASSDAPRSFAEKVEIDPDYENRPGYDPDFLAIRLKLPKIRREAENVAPLLDSPNESELTYQHFSIRMNKRTRLAFYTAVNIDGASWRSIDRDTGEPKREAKEIWYVDPRIDARHQLSQSFFDQTSYLFDRGHLVRRLDPTWGSDRKAIRANADTFHFTNCSPQNWQFNQKSKYWQGIEFFLLERGAVADRERITVFSGPVFRSGEDYAIEGIDQLIPARYWKIAVRVVGGKFVASGFLADQSEMINNVREGIASLATLTKYTKVFRRSIADIADLAGLDFDVLVPHDTLPPGPESSREITSWKDVF